MRKRYEVAGMMEWHPVFRAGRTRIQVSFRGGHLCGGASTAATYETSDAVVQAVIERSEAYKSGRIRLGRCWEEKGPGCQVAQKGQGVKGSGCQSSQSSQRSQSAQTNQSPQSVQSSQTPRIDKSVQKPQSLFSFEYEKIGEVSDELHYNHGIPFERLLDEESCRREADALGIELIHKPSA